MNDFNRNDTNVLKGIATLLLLFHHVFYSTFVLGNNIGQFFLFPQLTSRITISGKACVGIFATLTGYGLYKGLERKDVKTLIIDREASLLKVYIPLYIIFAFSFIILNDDGLYRFLSIYSYGENIGVVSTVVKIIINAFGLQRICNTETLNETWWYISNYHVIVFVTPFLIAISKRSNNKNIILFVLFVSCFLISDKQVSFPAYIMASYIGYCVGDSKILTDELLNKNLFVSLTVCMVLILVSISSLEFINHVLV